MSVVGNSDDSGRMRNLDLKEYLPWLSSCDALSWWTVSLPAYQSRTAFNVSGWAVLWVVVFLGRFPRYRMSEGNQVKGDICLEVSRKH